ncbi:MAG: 3-oxoacyl-ACP synthase, partial [Xanthomarina gelatinilytica]|nr:3-oxoacyl-ACP synthase [Xanthomarina gelatinilytica]
DSEKENNIALVFSNKAASLDTDISHQKAIQHKDNYFPSPAVFVYTLPNICLGEISIKYKLYTENSFFIFERFNAEHLFSYTNSLLETNKAKSVLCGWVELEGDNYEAFLYLVSKEGHLQHNTQQITTLYNT